MTGLDLQAELVSREAAYDLILMTAHDNPEWQERGKRAGALAYLKEPFHEQSLLDAIQRASGRP